jgi:hypothetical protein
MEYYKGRIWSAPGIVGVLCGVWEELNIKSWIK